jgi:hypothetical protein
MKTEKMNRATIALLLPVTALVLAGCWTPPNANVQPTGEARLIQSGIATESVKNPATVTAVDAVQGTVSLQLSDGRTITCKAGPKVKKLEELKPGDKLKATVVEDLAVYVLHNGQAPGAGGAMVTIHPNAKVQTVDPAYRLLELQYPDGHVEEVKVGLDAKMMEMSPGDDVVVTTGELLAFKLLKD